MDLLHANIEKALNKEIIRKALYKYFVDKGLENIHERVYPPYIRDIVEQVPFISDQIEITPNSKELDPRKGTAIIGWNLFLMGTQRMDLGDTYHRSLTELEHNSEPFGSPEEVDEKARNTRTVAEIIRFIVETLGEKENAFDFTDTGQTAQPIHVDTAHGAVGYKKNTTARPERHANPQREGR